MSTKTLDKKPQATREKIVENLREPSNNSDALEEFPPKELREAGLTRGGSPHSPQSESTPDKPAPSNSEDR